MANHTKGPPIISPKQVIDKLSNVDTQIDEYFMPRIHQTIVLDAISALMKVRTHALNLIKYKELLNLWKHPILLLIHLLIVME